jgi:hypothetical protein
MRLPIFHVSALLETGTTGRDGLQPEALVELLDELTDLGAQTPGFPAVLAGWLPIFSHDTPYLPLFGGQTVEDVVSWMMMTHRVGATSGWLVDTTADGPITGLGGDALPLLWGHGVIPVLRGPGDDALTHLAPGELRRRLRAARDSFAEQFGWQPSWIAPPAPVAGAATDELVRREIRDAGFRGMLVPAQPTGRDAADLTTCRPDQPVPFRTVGPSDDISQLRDWVRGSWRARSTSRLRHLTDTPRRIADRLFGD